MVSWRQRVRDLEEENTFLREVVESQKKRIDALEHHLLAYENPHTPPSKSRKKPPKKKRKGKRGAKNGHPRWERKRPEPTSRIKYIEKSCPDCYSALGEPIKSVSKIIEEIPEPQPIEVVEHVVHHYKCCGCGKRVVAKHNIPKGHFGRNLQTHVTLMKFDDRLPLRKVVNSLERHYRIGITDVTVMNITSRVARKLHAPYKRTIRGIRKADVSYVDETPFEVDGVQYYLWTFVTERETLFVIRNSRNRKVIREILGPRFKGTICSDGWQEYVRYTRNLQRCWAHLLREAKDLAEKYNSFQGFHAAIKQLFVKIKKLRSRPPPLERRKRRKEELIKEMEQLLEQMNPYKAFRKLRTKILNGLPYWFTCVVNLRVEPTNNIAERALRELIIQRNIMKGLRSDEGADTMGIICSVIATARQNERPVFQTIKNYL